MHVAAGLVPAKSSRRKACRYGAPPLPLSLSRRAGEGWGEGGMMMPLTPGTSFANDVPPPSPRKRGEGGKNNMSSLSRPHAGEGWGEGGMMMPLTPGTSFANDVPPPSPRTRGEGGKKQHVPLSRRAGEGWGEGGLIKNTPETFRGVF